MCTQVHVHTGTCSVYIQGHVHIPYTKEKKKKQRACQEKQPEQRRLEHYERKNTECKGAPTWLAEVSERSETRLDSGASHQSKEREGRKV